MSISKLWNPQDQIRTLLTRYVGQKNINIQYVDKGKNNKVFSRIIELSTLFDIFISFLFPTFFSSIIHYIFFMVHFFNLTIFFWLFFFFFPLLFADFFHPFLNFSFFVFAIPTLSLYFHHSDIIEQVYSWNTLGKRFKKERLINRLNRVTNNNVSRKESGGSK